MFDADRPITLSTEDRLGRSTFARYLARCLLDHTDPDSMVIGLYGAWGSGKTSVINLVVEELSRASANLLDDEKPIILNFSAWSYSGQNQLIYNFFRRLSSVLKESVSLHNKAQIIHLLELYVSYFTNKTTPSIMRAAPTFTEKLTLKKPGIWVAWESGRDLTQIKAELNILLKQEKCRIIIFIDNISRLYPKEIKQVFQIVKSMGDYANTSYVLALDKKYIVHAINKLDGSGGEDYLEKIVQLPFEIPQINQQEIEPILFDRLNEIVATVPEGTWNNEYWADIYYSALKYFFHNCRDITRYVNTLSFGYPRVRDIVNPVDFFALTAIEVFLPTIYHGIHDNKDLFTDLLDHVYPPDRGQLERESLRCEALLALDPSVPHEIIVDLFIRLFPRLRHIYEPNIPSYHSAQIAHLNKRVCSPDFFDGYFRLSMQANSMLPSEFHSILALAKNPVAFDHTLSRLNQDAKIIKFLNLFDHKTIKKIPKENIPAIIAALMDCGDLFPVGMAGCGLSLDTPLRIHLILHELLQQITPADQRFIIMQNAISKAYKSIYIIIHELQEQSREHMDHEDTFLPLEFREFNPEELSSLKLLAVTRIQYWAKHDSLIDHPQLIAILRAWHAWGKPEDCHQYVQQLTDSDKGLVAFLVGILDLAIAQVMTKYEIDPAWHGYIQDIDKFIAPEKLEAHANLLFKDNYFEKLREREQLALMIFLDLMKSSTIKTIPNTTAD